jgi:hypothetical protein
MSLLADALCQEDCYMGDRILVGDDLTRCFAVIRQKTDGSAGYGFWWFML